MASLGSTLKTGMLGTSRLASNNPMRARASGLLAGSGNTNSHIGELLFMVVVELLILAFLRKKFKGHHGG